MRKVLLCMIVLAMFNVSMQAIEVTMQGSIYAEIASEPGNELRAGTRVKLYSELVSSGLNSGKVRLIGLNQKAGDLNSFMSSSYLTLDNLINWVEVQLKGYMFPQGPIAIVSLGNVEVDYSPYTISLKDDLLNNYHSSYLNHRGVSIKELSIGGFSSEGFIIWGFNDPLKNAMGGKFYREFGQTNFTGIIVDYRYRTQDAEKKIIDSFIRDQKLDSILEWEQTRSIEMERKIGKFGLLKFTIADMGQKHYNRVNDYTIEAVKENNIFQEYEWQVPIVDDMNFLIGYRDIPLGFDPIFRDRTPEFDAVKGYYLGYNPIDKYKDKVGFYTKIKAQKGNLKLAVSLEDMKDHRVLYNKFQAMEFAMLGQLSSYEIDIFSRLKETNNWLSTGIRNTTEEGFTRLILSRPIGIGKTSFVTGLEFRKESNLTGVHDQGILFARYQKGDYLEINAGIIQALSEKASTGNYWGLNYKAPNGLIVRYRHAFPTIISDGKYHYDPDYRLRDEGSIAQLSANISF